VIQAKGPKGRCRLDLRSQLKETKRGHAPPGPSGRLDRKARFIHFDPHRQRDLHPISRPVG